MRGGRAMSERNPDGFIAFELSEADIEWAKRVAREEQEYFSHQAVADERLTEAETKWVGCACGLSLSDLASCQLELLANRHLDAIMAMEFDVRFNPFGTGWATRPSARRSPRTMQNGGVASRKPRRKSVTWRRAWSAETHERLRTFPSGTPESAETAHTRSGKPSSDPV
jgi:hypothetical protein